MSLASDLLRDPLIAKIILFGGLTFAFNNPLWTDNQGAAKTLADHGYTNVSVGGYDWRSGFGGFKTKYSATNPLGHQEHGAVNEGFVFTGAKIVYEP